MTRLTWILFYSSCAFLVAVGGWRALVSNRSFDFAPVYGGSKCLVNHCNPYDTAQLDRELYQSGAKSRDVGAWHDEMPVYPPSTFVAVLPFTVFSYKTARALWFVFSVITFCGGAFATVELCNPLTKTIGIALVSIILVSSTGGFGNPGPPAIGLAVIAMWILLRTSQWIPAALLLGISIALKPHLAGPLLIWLVLQAGYRRAVLLSAAVSVLLLFGSVAWLERTPGSANWVGELRSNLALAGGPSGINDPSVNNPDAMRMTNLQTAFAAIQPDSRWYNGGAWLVAAICFGIWLLLALRARPSDQTRFFELASLACLTLLPVYHRLEDARLLLLAVPALASLVLSHRLAGLAAACLTAPVLFSLAFQFQHLFAGAQYMSGASLNPLTFLLISRQAPIALLALTLIYLWALWKSGASSVTWRLGADGIRTAL
jgi:hypothetical protein